MVCVRNITPYPQREGGREGGRERERERETREEGESKGETKRGGGRARERRMYSTWAITLLSFQIELLLIVCVHILSSFAQYS